MSLAWGVSAVASCVCATKVCVFVHYREYANGVNGNQDLMMQKTMQELCLKVSVSVGIIKQQIIWH